MPSPFAMAPGTHTVAASVGSWDHGLGGDMGEPGVGGENTLLFWVSVSEDLLLFLRQAGHHPGCLVDSAPGLVNI